MTQVKLDANAATLYLNKELQEIDPKLYEVKHHAIKYPSFIRTEMSNNEFISHYNYQIMQRTGKAAWVRSNSDNIPVVGEFMKEVQVPVFNMASQANFEYDSVMLAMQNGHNLVAQKTTTAMQSLDQLMEEVVANGSGMPGGPQSGLLNNPDVAANTIDLNANGDWITNATTGEAMVEQLQAAIDAIIEDSDGIEVPNRMILPVKEFNYLKRTRIDVGSGSDETAMSRLLGDNPGLRIDFWNFCDTVGSSANGRGTRGIVYSDDASRVSLLQVRIKQRAPLVRENHLHYSVVYNARTAGVIFKLPKSARYIDGM